MKIPRSIIENYVRTSYRVVGKNKHSSIKPCYWLDKNSKPVEIIGIVTKAIGGLILNSVFRTLPHFPLQS